MAANHNTTYTISANIGSLRRLLSDTNLMNQKKMTLRQEIGEGGRIRYVYDHGMSFSSWGEEINVVLTPLSDTATQVYIESRCSMPTQIIDMGKNKQNVYNIYTLIMENIARYPAPFNSAQTTPQYTQPASPQASNSENRFCSGCGKPLGQGFAFCSACGKKVQ